MKLKLLLFVFLLGGGTLFAGDNSYNDSIDYIYNDTIDYLVISEVNMTTIHQTYLELTNMGDEPVQLDQFNLGSWGGGDSLVNMQAMGGSLDYRIPTDKILEPGESFVMALINDWAPTGFLKEIVGNSEKTTQDAMWELADMQVHHTENDGLDGDSITGVFEDPFLQQWGPGMNGFYIEQHFANGDSVLIDQVGGTFQGEDGGQLNRTSNLEGYDVAGVYKATGNSYLIRRFNVKKGNLDFENARGIGLNDSEWIPIPKHGSAWRDPMWTVGNHGAYILNENTLESDVADVDFSKKTITIPWGVKRGDDIINLFTHKPGIGWEYFVGANVDSLTFAAQTGDKLKLYVCGNSASIEIFNIIVEDPAPDAKILLPVSNKDANGNWREDVDDGELGWPRITNNASAMDSIWGVRGGIPFATRVDTLLKRLDNPSNATLEFVYTTELEKPDISNGDKIKVTAQDGSSKTYYISVLPYRADDNASLSSITWPDIPEFYKGVFGWVGDTIPGFTSTSFAYNVEIPLMAPEGIPAMVAKTSDPNASVVVKRATSFTGDIDSRTITFTVTAEDDTTITNPPYSVTLSKQKDPSKLQPWVAEPFISEIVQNNYWTGNGYVELCNPGNQPLDLSDYMFVGGQGTPAEIIADLNNGEGDWLNRYEKYIPGYKWQSEAEWAVETYFAELDLSVSSIVNPGDVFLMGATPKLHSAYCDDEQIQNIFQNEVDVQFLSSQDPETSCFYVENQWGEELDRGDIAIKGGSRTSQFYLFKILNDSIKQGLKAAIDPNDFELIDAFGMGEDATWVVPGAAWKDVHACPDLRRLPGIYKGNPEIGGSLGVNNPDDVEWSMENHKTLQNLGLGWPERMTNLLKDLGKHFMDEPTVYKSTVSSLVYKVSNGYSMDEQIRGVTTGTTVSSFLDNVIKADTAQTLTITSAGVVLGMADALSLDDVLTVISADSTNTSAYVIEVTEQGLNSNAVLTSTTLTIDVDADSGVGSVSGFEYGTSVQNVIDNVTVPAGAILTVINGAGAYVPFTQLNFDTTYVTVNVTDDIYFEVVAENGVNTIVYQLIPTAEESFAFVTSVVYSVVESDLLIDYVPRGTNVLSFLANLTPSTGATMKLVDKKGFERTVGGVADDDKVIVTSADGSVTNIYYISKLPTEFITTTTYLAYILSDLYKIDQVDYIIDGVSSTESISEFSSNIWAVFGASAVVVNKDGGVRTAGTLTGSDLVKVTSADGKIEVMYTFGHITSVQRLEANQIVLYPNPSSGKINITGVEKGNRIQVYNSIGTAVFDIDVESNHEVISLDQQPAGMYLIVVSENNQPIGKFKAIRN